MKKGYVSRILNHVTFIHLLTCLLTFGVNFFNNFQKKIHVMIFKILKSAQIRDSISILMIFKEEKLKRDIERPDFLGG